jgi:ketosteroid isomerase-like protein
VVDQETEVELIRAADRALLEAETRRDLPGAMALFAEGAIIQPPDAPPVVGREAVRAFYDDWFALPYAGIYPDSSRVAVSASGDLGYLIGYSYIEMDAAAGGGRLDGKYISLWRKVDGRWLCAGVSWSGNSPSG